MNKYVPFLKLKVNEIGALKELHTDIIPFVTPFFDFPKEQDGTPDTFLIRVVKAAKSVSKNLDGFQSIYIDNFDVDDSIVINGQNSYACIIERFQNINFIPVVGLDRTYERNELVYTHKYTGLIKSDLFAIRLQEDDFINFDLIRADIEYLYKRGSEVYKDCILIIDNRLCADIDTKNRSSAIIKFLSDCLNEFDFNHVVITGSSIPASVADIMDVKSDGEIQRQEIDIFRSIKLGSEHVDLVFGDYTIISPLYSEFNIPPEIIRNVMAPKIFYTHGDVHYIARGGALKTHPRGDLQYNDIAADLVLREFYRGSEYSFGDLYLYQKGQYSGSKVTPSSILKPTINLHISFMVRDQGV